MNYVYKRPTDKPLADVTIGNYGGLSPYLHGDFGGPIDKDGQFSYRLNIVGQTGDAPVDQQSVKRDVLTAALAWRPVQDMSFTFIASHMDFDVRGADPFELRDQFRRLQQGAPSGRARPDEILRSASLRLRHAARSRRSRFQMEDRRRLHRARSLFL
jgi:hypothetical protein